jgi:hypothetical protein
MAMEKAAESHFFWDRHIQVLTHGGVPVAGT